MVDIGDGLNCVSGAGEVGGSGAGDTFTSKMFPSSSWDRSSSPSVEAVDCGLFKALAMDGNNRSALSSCSRLSARDRVSGPDWLLRARWMLLEVVFRIAGMARLYGAFWYRSR